MQHLSPRIVRSALVFVLLCSVHVPAFAQYTVHTLLDNGAPDRRMHLVLVAEAYREEELPLFIEDAKQVMGDFFATSPFKEYKSYFNVLAVAVASNESGIDQPHLGIFRDTYFDVSFGCGTGVCIQQGTGAERFYMLQESLMAERGYLDPVYMVLANDTTTDFGHGTPLLSVKGKHGYTHVMHELGHQFANLADEYDEPGRGAYEAANITAESRREYIKWRHWISDDTPIPTPAGSTFGQAVGLFLGAIESNWFRPQETCKMRWSEDPYCAVCREQIVSYIYQSVAWSNRLRRIRQFAPADTVQALQAGATLHMSVDAPLPEHGLGFEWSVDGVPVAQGEASLSVAANDLGPGQHMVELRVIDESPFVRDPEILPQMMQAHRWRLNVAAPVATERDELPADVALYPNFPNPVREGTVFSFHLPEASHVSLTVFDAIGREAAAVAEGFYAAGPHSIEWKPSGLTAGVYTYSLRVGTRRMTRRMVVSR